MACCESLATADHVRTCNTWLVWTLKVSWWAHYWRRTLQNRSFASRILFAVNREFTACTIFGDGSEALNLRVGWHTFIFVSAFNHRYFVCQVVAAALVGVRDTSLAQFTVNRSQGIQAATLSCSSHASSGMRAKELACRAAFSCHICGTFWFATEASERQWSLSTDWFDILAKLVVRSAHISARAFVNQRCRFREACRACCCSDLSKFFLIEANGFNRLQRRSSRDCLGIYNKYKAR